MAKIFLAVVIICFVVAFMLDFFNISRSTQRRIYWINAFLAAIAGFAMFYPDWQKGLGMGAFLFAVMTFIAYAATPYIKIDGKIYAFTVTNSQPDPQDTPTTAGNDSDGASSTNRIDPVPDSYSGMLTPATLWWSLVVLAVFLAANVYFFVFTDGKASVAAVSGAFLAFLAITGGYGDASWGYPIARGKYVPFCVVSVITAGAFALLYLSAYYTARRFPLRRTQSMEYRAHPRHRSQPDNRGTD